jgi:hypothetical protein
VFVQNSLLSKVRLAIGSVFIALVVSACGQGGAPVQSVYPMRISQGSPRAAQQYLYVDNRISSTENYISFYNTGKPIQELGSIPTGNRYSILAVGPDGNLYAGQDGYKFHSSVAVYDGKTGALLRTITRGITTIMAMAMDAKGTLYVANRKSVTIYPNGESEHMRKIVIYERAPISRMAVDPAGDLYVATYSQIYVYPAGSNTPKEVITTDSKEVQSLAVDISGNLFVSSLTSSSCAELAVFAPGQTSPAYVIPGAGNACVWFGLTASANGDMYALTSSSSGVMTVSAYAYGQTSPVLVITRGIHDAAAMVFDAVGNLYVSDSTSNMIVVYRPGETAVRRRITAGISGPSSMAMSGATTN